MKGGGYGGHTDDMTEESAYGIPLLIALLKCILFVNLKRRWNEVACGKRFASAIAARGGGGGTAYNQTDQRHGQGAIQYK